MNSLYELHFANESNRFNIDLSKEPEIWDYDNFLNLSLLMFSVLLRSV